MKWFTKKTEQCRVHLDLGYAMAQCRLTMGHEDKHWTEIGVLWDNETTGAAIYKVENLRADMTRVR